jgi:hypothetical protein
LRRAALTRFVEAVLDLPALTARDANADARLDRFDFDRPRRPCQPRPPSGREGCAKGPCAPLELTAHKRCAHGIAPNAVSPM